VGVGRHAGAFAEVLLDLLQQLRHRIGGYQRTGLAVRISQQQPDPVGGQHDLGRVDQLLQDGR